MIETPAAFQVGSYVFSRSRFHADDEHQPVGGVVIRLYDRTNPDTGEVEACCQVVAIWRGRVLYHTIPVGDVEPGASCGLIRPDVLKQLALRLAADEAERKDPFAHDDARRAIHRALIAHGARP